MIIPYGEDPRTDLQKAQDEYVRNRVEAAKRLRDEFGLDIDIDEVVKDCNRVIKSGIPLPNS